VLLVTTHGKFALASCTDAELGEFDRRGFVHRVDRKGRFKLDGLPDFYQTTFHTREYVNRAWSRHFDVVDHIEGGLGRHQDVVLLRSTEGGSPAQAGPSNPDFDPAVHRERVRKWQESNGDERLLTRYDRLNADSIILDLGGYHGDFSFHMNSKYGALCHVFEVVPELCSRIESARAGNPKIVVHAFGLAGSTRKERLFLAEQGSSTFANRAPEARQIAIQLVEASDWFRKELEGRSVDLMKINIEGGEYELLEHMIRKGLARRVRNIQVQFHEDVIADAAARMGRIQADLSKTHRLTFQERFVWENWELLDRDETNFC